MSKITTKIVYDLKFNQIIGYWEKIKYKIYFKKAEDLKKKISALKNANEKNEVLIKAQEKELKKAVRKVNKLKLEGAINTSYKVYRVYKELVKIINDKNSEWEYDSHKANHAIEFVITGVRKYKEILLFVARKNGKSTLATAIGLNVHCALLDEIHTLTDKNLYDVIVDGTTAREEPIIFITTIAGTIRECVYDIKYDEAERLITGRTAKFRRPFHILFAIRARCDMILLSIYWRDIQAGLYPYCLRRSFCEGGRREEVSRCIV